jgi:uncharacterized membrane protein
MVLSLVFLSANAGLTGVTILLGPHYYGYGFACATLLTSVVGLIWLSRQFDDLEYETFMQQ